MTERCGWQPFAREQDGLVTWAYGDAPRGLVTRRQLRVAGLASGGAKPVGQVVFTHRRRRRVEVRALLWNPEELVAKRTPTPAQVRTLARAMAARRWCPSCTRDVGYCICTALGKCTDCAFPDLAAAVITPPSDLAIRSCEESSHVA